MRSSREYEQVRMGIEAILGQATDRVLGEGKRIRAKNEVEIAARQARHKYLFTCRRDLITALVAARRRAYGGGARRVSPWTLFLALFLTTCGFLFALKTLEQFALGWTAWIVCAGLAMAVPYGLERFLREFPHRAVARTLVVATAVAALGTAILFGVLRGSVMAFGLGAEPSVTINDIHDDAKETGDAN